jgi:hypothetical protein
VTDIHTYNIEPFCPERDVDDHEEVELLLEGYRSDLQATDFIPKTLLLLYFLKVAQARERARNIKRFISQHPTMEPQRIFNKTIFRKN